MTYDSLSDTLEGSTAQASALFFACGIRIKAAIEAQAIMCHQEDWSTQIDEDIVVTSPDFLSTSEELKCPEGHFIDGIQFDTQEGREEPEYHLAYKDLGFSIDSTSLVSLGDPTIDGSSCIEKDMAPPDIIEQEDQL